MDVPFVSSTCRCANFVSQVGRTLDACVPRDIHKLYTHTLYKTNSLQIRLGIFDYAYFSYLVADVGLSLSRLGPIYYL